MVNLNKLHYCNKDGVDESDSKSLAMICSFGTFLVFSDFYIMVFCKVRHILGKQAKFFLNAIYILITV